MPTTNKTGLAAKFGNKLDNAIKKAAVAEVNPGFIKLPGGIDQGIAQLTQCYFAQYEKGENKGEYYFRAVGNVHEPEFIEINGAKKRCRGLQTSIMVPLCDTKNSKGEITTAEEHLQNSIINHMKLLGGPDYVPDDTGIGDLEALAEGLVELAPFFVFSTSESAATKEYPNPRVWENWHGTEGAEDYVPVDPNAMVDNTKTVGVKEIAKPAATNGKPPPTATKTSTKAPAKKEPEPEPFVPETCEDLDLLLLDADGQNDTNQASQERIKELGIAAGVSEKAQAKLNTWSEVVDAIKEALAGNGSNDEGEGLKVGSVVGFHPKHPVTKKPAKDPVSCIITAINDAGDKVELKAGKATYKNIAVEDLVEAPSE